MDTYKANYDVILSLPIVQELLKKNKKLRKENKALKNLVYSLPEFRCECHSNDVPRQTLDLVKIKSEPGIEPTQCEPLVANDDDDVIFVEPPPANPNIVYVIDDDVPVIIKKENIENAEVEGGEIVEVEEEDEAEDEEEVEGEEEEEEEEVEDNGDKAEEVEGEAEAEEEEVEDNGDEAEAEEEEVEAEEEGVFEIQISKKSYYTNNETNGKIYTILADEDVGPEVGVFQNGKPVFHKKK